MRVRDVMLTDPVVVTPSTTLADARAIATEHGRSSLPVVRGGRLLGLLDPADLASDADVLRVVAGLQPTLDARSHELVEKLARRPAAVLEPAHTLETAARLMVLKGCAVLPVVANGDLVGILTIDHLRRSLTGTQEQAALAASVAS